MKAQYSIVGPEIKENKAKGIFAVISMWEQSPLGGDEMLSSVGLFCIRDLQVD